MKYKDNYRGDLLRVGAMFEQAHIQIQEMLKLNTEHELRWHLKNTLDNVDRMREALMRTYERELEKELQEQFGTLRLPQDKETR